MVKNCYETIMMFILCFIDKVEKIYLKHYPVLAFVFSIFFALALAREYDLGHEINIVKIIITAWVITGLSLLWIIKTKR